MGSSGRARSTSLTGALPRARRGLLLATFGVLGLLLVVHTALALTGVSTAAGAGVRWSDTLYSAVGLVAAVLTCLRAFWIGHERAAWAWIAGSMVLFALGNVAWSVLYLNVDEPPFPSVCDALWIGCYALNYVGLALLIRSRLRRVPRAVLLDGLMSAAGVSAVVVGLLLAPIVTRTQGPPLTVVTTLAYPVGDLMLLVLCAVALTLTRGRPSRSWLLLVTGLVANGAADTAYVFLASTGSYVDGGPIDTAWLVATCCVAAAGWQPARSSATTETESGTGPAQHLLPVAAGAAAIGLLAHGALGSGVTSAAVLLALLTLALAGVRVALVVREVQALGDSHRLAESDELTGLLNRRGLTQRLEALGVQAEHDRTEVSLLLLDLDRFKEVNDTLGHQVGDQLLAEVGQRLRRALPGAMLARLGGDEFVAVLPVPVPVALSVAERLLSTLAVPFELDGVVTLTRASIGVTGSPGRGRRGDLLRQGDIAMYKAKQRGTGVELYAPQDDRHSRERLALVAELRRALDDPAQLVLHYQPQIELGTGRVEALEALVRWQHPAHGLLMPDAFLEVADEHALMHRLTLAVIERVLRQQQAWRAAGIDLTVAVNISAADLLDLSLPDRVASLLEQHRAPRGSLRFELIESSVMREPEQVLTTLARLRGLGVSLALDDFGTGYSSLGHLKRLPVQELKIDRSFVRDMLTDRDDAVIVRSTVELARSLGLRVVAEGVETVEQLERLRYFGCHLVQGFLICRPVPPADLVTWLSEHRTRFATGPLGPEPAAGAELDENVLVGVLTDLALLVVDRAPLPELVAAVATALGTLVPNDDVVVYRHDRQQGTLSTLYSQGRWVLGAEDGEVFAATEGITGSAVREGRMRTVARTDLDPDSVRVAGTEEESEALVCCPLVVQGRSLGVVNVYRSGTWVPFSREEAAVIARFATLVGLGLAVAERSERALVGVHR